MYKLVSENLTNVGGPMGMNSSYENWTKYFVHKENAVKHAENIEGVRHIEWFTYPLGNMRSQDMGNVMYHIQKVKTEDK